MFGPSAFRLKAEAARLRAIALRRASKNILLQARGLQTLGDDRLQAEVR
jgi:hypothetical protein